jgi:cystinosin
MDLVSSVAGFLVSRSDRSWSTLCWSASFYPQPILNWHRKSTQGLAIDFPTVNVLGFLCYTISTSALLYSPVIRQQYAQRHSGSPEPTVQLNDVAFAVHAVVMSSIYYSQFWPKLWGFKVGLVQRISRPITGIFWGSILAVLLTILLVLTKGKTGSRDGQDWAWIDVVRAEREHDPDRATGADLRRSTLWAMSNYV